MRHLRDAQIEQKLTMQIGMAIRELRREQGKTLEELAFSAGTDASNLSRVERGRQQCGPDWLARIAAALGVSVSVLYQRTETAPSTVREPPPRRQRPKPAPDEELQRRFHDLTPDNRDLALAFIHLLARRQGRAAESLSAAVDAQSES